MKRMIGILLALLCMGLLPAQAAESGIQDLAHARIGATIGSVQAQILPQVLPEASVIEYNSTTDLAMALEAGRLEAFATEEPVYLAMKREGMAFTRMQEPLLISEYGMLFGKDAPDQMRQDFNRFLREFTESGRMEAQKARWFGDGEPEELLLVDGFTGEKGRILFAIEPSVKPFAYIKNGQFTGFDVELMTFFAQAYGYELVVENTTFGGLLAGIEQGRYDMAGSGVTITAERRETMIFSDPYHKEEIVLVIPAETNGKRTLEDFANATLGVIDGSLYDGISKELFPQARRDSYPSFNDLFQCVKQGKIDGFLLDIPNLSAVARTDDRLSWIPVPGCTVEIGIAFGKNDMGDRLQAEVNAFLAQIRENGVYDSMWEAWCGEAEPDQAPVLPDLSGGRDLKIAVDLSRKPFVYLLNNEYAGFEIELLYRFCEAYGYNPVFESAQWTAGVAGLKSGKYDVVSCGIYMTEERKESVNFCEPYVIADVVMVIYEEAAEEISLWESLQESFEKTFIREDRWKLIAEGVVVTVVISVCSAAGGSILGFALYMLARSEYRAVSVPTKVITRVYARIIAGTPMLVVLMILFYVFFGKSDISSLLVAIIGFSLTFGSFVYGHLTLCVEGIDRGQTEAAYALGYTRSQAFFRIILPQAMKTFLPTYTGEVVGLIKATSVVGYIAVNDLTKMGDIIRSNTYEAMFPLLAVAAIYFLITWGAAALLGRVQQRLDHHRRKNESILKGVVR